MAHMFTAITSALGYCGKKKYQRKIAEAQSRVFVLLLSATAIIVTHMIAQVLKTAK